MPRHYRMIAESEPDFRRCRSGKEGMLARRKMRSKELAERIGITEQNVSLLKSGKVKGVRFDTLEAICRALDCQPGDILEYRADTEGARKAS
jgi:putative transcriptional regulator